MPANYMVSIKNDETKTLENAFPFETDATTATWIASLKNILLQRPITEKYIGETIAALSDANVSALEKFSSTLHTKIAKHVGLEASINHFTGIQGPRLPKALRISLIDAKNTITHIVNFTPIQWISFYTLCSHIMEEQKTLQELNISDDPFKSIGVMKRRQRNKVALDRANQDLEQEPIKGLSEIEAAKRQVAGRKAGRNAVEMMQQRKETKERQEKATNDDTTSRSDAGEVDADFNVEAALPGLRRRMQKARKSGQLKPAEPAAQAPASVEQKNPDDAKKRHVKANDATGRSDVVQADIDFGNVDDPTHVKARRGQRKKRSGFERATMDATLISTTLAATAETKADATPTSAKQTQKDSWKRVALKCTTGLGFGLGTVSAGFAACVLVNASMTAVVAGASTAVGTLMLAHPIALAAVIFACLALIAGSVAAGFAFPSKKAFLHTHSSTGTPQETLTQLTSTK